MEVLSVLVKVEVALSEIVVDSNEDPVLVPVEDIDELSVEPTVVVPVVENVKDMVEVWVVDGDLTSQSIKSLLQ